MPPNKSLERMRERYSAKLIHRRARRSTQTLGVTATLTLRLSIRASTLSQPLSRSLPGTWQLLSRTDVSEAGLPVDEPTLGSDPIALLIYDTAGNFAAQFMKRDRTASTQQESKTAGANNTRAQGGYDAYFGRYTVDDSTGVVTQTLVGALSRESVGLEISRAMLVEGDHLSIQLKTTSTSSEPVVRTLRWRRVG